MCIGEPWPGGNTLKPGSQEVGGSIPGCAIPNLVSSVMNT